MRNYPLSYLSVVWTASDKIRALVRKQHATTTEVMHSLCVHYLANPIPPLPAPAFGSAEAAQLAVAQISPYALKTFGLHGTITMTLSQLNSLTDLLLDGYSEELYILTRYAESRAATGELEEEERNKIAAMRDQFDSLKIDAIRPFRLANNNPDAMAVGSNADWDELVLTGVQYALRLGEQYKEFNTLVEICDQYDNNERLHEYMARFQADGFANTLFKWYLSNGKFFVLSFYFYSYLGSYLKCIPFLFIFLFLLNFPFSNI